MSRYQRQKQSTSSSTTSPTMSDTGNESYPTIRRRRISKACNYCRQRKIKCNGSSPCLNCKNHHIECAYSKTSNIRKKKKTTTKKVTLQELGKRVNKMEQQFDLLSDKVSMILELLSKNGIKQHSHNHNEESETKKVEQATASELVSSDEEYEEDEELEQDDEHLLSPLSEYSQTTNSESISSNEQPEEPIIKNEELGSTMFQSDLLSNVNNYSLDQMSTQIPGFTEEQTQIDLIGILNYGLNGLNGFKDQLNYLYDSNQL
ncbi:Maltose fermentation regulatory protein MAL13 [Wickerhamomyces ciferrii]|uniref:Maltose fermentation regulatory protein MAL13 n=1 Tax=Wickerhamomyces ciferrii (strain ATCC 14091 / BCRC 22168 / CBS 111 / JCM 3599 / NBRC 0793 / NRRL Y-1031 F-60-10) TaxID=1206466 RepID=K0KIH9_WICCF|nr:Maltose fermentation regulatory protein MAL13 [Wickerhamomyces ciferrii]CCH41199.1 Maltose fermentation regulatory protein MAL13 [Wickerhamomyces ciferrii]